jgi:hypothetical protein
MTATENTARTARQDIDDNLRATIGSGRAVHRAFVVRRQAFVSCGAASRSGASRIRLTSNPEITCRKCLAE